MFRVIAAVTVVLSLSASAAFSDNDVSMNVPYGDLNLAQTQDAAVLAGRLRAAAEQVCVKANTAGLAESRIDQQAVQKCIEVAIGIAIERVESNLDDKIHASLIDAKQQAAP